jgi:protein N-terminal methyltransferase
MIWLQLVIGYLTDLDFIRFFQRCKKGLKDNGIIVVKDNAMVGPEMSFNIDHNDSSVTRNIEYLKILFHQSGLKIIATAFQGDFPSEYYPVVMIALAPDENQYFNRELSLF